MTTNAPAFHAANLPAEATRVAAQWPPGGAPSRLVALGNLNPCRSDGAGGSLTDALYSGPMIRISVTEAAFSAAADTLPFGT
jgi:hypothetical protein